MNRRRFFLLGVLVAASTGVSIPEARSQRVDIDLGSIPPGATVTLEFRVAIDDPLPPSVTEVSNQVGITGSNFPDALTDDPDTAAPGDPTRTDVFQPPVVVARDVVRLATAGAVVAVTPEAVDDGSFDPDGGAVALTLAPPGPYAVGRTPVILTAIDDEMDSATRSARVVIRSPLFPRDLLLLLGDVRAGTATNRDVVDRSPEWYLRLK